MDEATPVPPAGAQQARLRTDVFVTFGGKAATLLLGLATAAIVARELGPSGQAVFAVAFTLTPRPRAGRRAGLHHRESVLRRPRARALAAGRRQRGLVLGAARPGPDCRRHRPEAGLAVCDRGARLGAVARDPGRHSGRTRRRQPPVDPARPGAHGRLQRDRGRADRLHADRGRGRLPGVRQRAHRSARRDRRRALRSGRRRARAPAGLSGAPGPRLRALAPHVRLRSPHLRRDPRLVPRHPGRPLSRQLDRRTRRGRRLLDCGGPRGRDVRDPDGDRPQPLPARRPR